MADFSLIGSDTAVTFMVSAGLVYEIIAAACSSPQTTEINAGQRSETLMKWVIIGMLQAAVFVIIAAMMSKEKWPALVGGGLAGGMMWVSYAHANRAGLASDKPGTEQY
jgi:hypothetical protein